MKFFIALLFIGVSLQSYYFYQIGSPLISILSLIFLSLIVLKDLNIKLNNSNYVLLFYFFIFIFSLLSLLYFNEGLVSKKLFGFFIIFLSCITANNLYKSFNIFYLIRLYLKFHILFFYIQLLAFYIFKFHIDFLQPITGEEQRVFGGNFEIPYINSFMRPSGLFNEPGTYVTFIAPFIVLFGRWKNNFVTQDYFIYVLGLFSLFLSFSVFGIIFGILILLFGSIYKFKTRIFFGSIISSTIIIPYITFRFFFSETNLNVDSDSGLGFREIFLSESYKFIMSDIGAFFFGSGHLSNNPKANFIASYNDIGLVPFLLHFSGPFLTFFLLIAILKMFLTIDRFAIVGIIMLFISKLSILAPFFPFILTLLLWPEMNFKKLYKNLTIR